MDDASNADLSSICCLATLQFSAVTWRVACNDKFTCALVPWERVVGMVGGDALTLEVAIFLVSGDGRVGEVGI
jgi:hypothetical protein